MRLRWPALVSYVLPENAPSRAVAQRLGARFDGQVRIRQTPVDVWRHQMPA